jgi:3-dehydroquinate synthase class II
MKVAGKVIDNKEVSVYTKIKDFNDEDLVPRAKTKALTDNYILKQKDENIIPGARVINFDENKDLCKKYKQQREADRKRSSNKKSAISGSSLSSVYW